HRERLAAQVAHLAAHPRVAVVGARLRLFPAAATGAGMRRWARWHNALLDHAAMRREALIDSPLAHGTALLRRGPLEAAGGWRERGWAEDMDLWLRLFERGERFAKLPRVLYGWRQHPGSSTRTDPRYARERFVALKLAALDRGLLAHGRRATLIGVGRSLAGWRAALGARVSRALEIRRPGAAPLAALAPPLVIALGAHEARMRWRHWLETSGLSELQDFIFIA
ncbi:MAG TPA: glycosyl transferase, partial [Candidatus Eisenbacteria bacterium]|nr:glycosyl transferase [Candidatus Eisenbacteria bacterium]